MKSTRCFFALELPVETKVKLERLGSYAYTIAREARLICTQVRERNFHITIRFLGEVPLQRLSELTGETVCAAFTRVPIASAVVMGLGGFPNINHPRVVWAGVTDSDGQFQKLYSSLSDALVGLGFSEEDAPYRPHITLLRLKGAQPGTTASWTGLSAWLDASRQLVVDEVHDLRPVLYKSLLTPTGPVYEVLRYF